MHELRAEFPVLQRVAYLNAGTNGPVPRKAVDAVAASLRRQVEDGRSGKALFEDAAARAGELRERAARMLGAQPDEVALTASTTDGVNTVLEASEIHPGDELLTTDEEHPGVLGPLAAARDGRGARVRVVPWDELASAAGPQTRMIVCSHVSWITGKVIDTEALGATGVEVLLDGAQSVGALPVDVRALGCHYYAGSGQKWLCGPNGIGYLYVRADRMAGLRPARSGYHALDDPGDPLGSSPKPGARRLDSGLQAHHQLTWAQAALDVLEAPGIERLQARATALAAGLAEQLAGRGMTVAPRGPTTLVSVRVDDPPALVERLASEKLVVRDLPGTAWVRASVGGWTSEDELDRLVAALTR